MGATARAKARSRNRYQNIVWGRPCTLLRLLHVAIRGSVSVPFTGRRGISVKNYRLDEQFEVSGGSYEILREGINK